MKEKAIAGSKVRRAILFTSRPTSGRPAMEAKIFTASKNNKECSAERSGELCLDDPDMRKIFRTHLIDERLNKYGPSQTTENRQKIERAYPTCIREYKCLGLTQIEQISDI